MVDYGTAHHYTRKAFGLEPWPLAPAESMVARLSVPTGDEITRRFGTRQQYPLLHRICDSLRDMQIDQPARRCGHGVNLDAAGCGQCLAADGVL